MSFRLIQKSVTLNNIERRNGRYSALFCVISANWVALDAHCVKWLKIYLNFLQQKCRPKCLVFFGDYHLRWYDVRNSAIWGIKRKRGSQHPTICAIHHGDGRLSPCWRRCDRQRLASIG